MRTASAFWYELRRRHVVRAAILYVGAVWALAQGIAQLGPAFGMSDWATRWFIIACSIGFPFWLVLAWLFELTPEGLKREGGIPRDAAAAQRAARKLDYAIIAVLSLAVVLLATNTLVWHKGPRLQHDGPDAAAVRVRVPQKSLAVLPLVNEGGNQSDEYFSDGIAEDLITALSQFAGLKVTSRNSAFQFRGTRASPAEIATKLGVAHLLVGSVLREGGAVRIRVELIKAADGSALWSRRYIRPYHDLFNLQDEITASVAQALKAKLLEGDGVVAQSDRPPGGSLDAYAAYLQGNAAFAGNNETDLRKAIEFYIRARDLDRRYAAAYAQLSMVWTNLANQFQSGEAASATYGSARAAANMALALDPKLAIAHAARGLLLSSGDFNWQGARDEYQRALALAPQDPKAQFYLASLLATLGQPERAVALTRQSLTADPRNVSRYDWLASFLVGLGRLDEARRVIETAIDLEPRASGLHSQLALIETVRGDAAAALADAQREAPGIWQNIAVAMAYQIGTDRDAADASLRVLIKHDADTSAYQIAQIYALRADPDRTFAWLDRAWNNRDSGLAYLLYDPFIARYRHAPRFAAFCSKVGLPVPGTTPAHPATAARGVIGS